MMNQREARPTTYLGTLYRSKSEACFAKWLKDYGFSFDYEPKDYAVDGYVPDFEVVYDAKYDKKAKSIIEYKPALVTESYVFEFMKRANAIDSKISRPEIKISANRQDSEPWRIERLHSVAEKIKILRPRGLVRIHDHKGTLEVYSYESSDLFREEVIKAWEEENECVVEFSQLLIPNFYSICCGSFFEDEPVWLFSYYPGSERGSWHKSWFGIEVSFEERRAISRNRFDLRGTR